MCTLVLLFRPGHEWPLLVGANRDELVERPWLPPARHWSDRAHVVAGLDLQAGGTWLGLNDAGVMASVLNRRHSLGGAPDKRSRGELVLEALDHDTADDASTALADLDARAYRPFNLVIADRLSAWWLRGLGEADDGGVERFPVPPGLSLFTSSDRNDQAASPRIRNYLPRFEACATPRPETGDWADWERLLACPDRLGEDANGAMLIQTDWGYGTVSSALIALPEAGDRKPLWRFATRGPAIEPYQPVAI
jgi:Transport and Golgi organisation 2